VRLVTLDSYLSERDLPKLRYVKIDAAGAEIRVLKGEHLLLSNAEFVWELHPHAWPSFGNTHAELKSLTTTAGRSHSLSRSDRGDQRTGGIWHRTLVTIA
jgi:hypothetical protein